MSTAIAEPQLGAITTAADLIYFSSVSGNTKRFVKKLQAYRSEGPAGEIPLHSNERPLKATRPYVLVLPTYGAGDGPGAVPKQVIKFLNDPDNRALIRGVVVGGNTNFGKAFGLAGDIIAAKTGVPCLYRFEVFGTQDDVEAVAEGLERFWQ
ncbi:MAG TPA: class Ib ribonucleoside-diphosphate reductase assembly flavoprotein NrdI [Microbacteriaceae bacterium]|nr:class Ib ribonucleoside-diphosphate reductase assembly flavoprotein NrdI [Microbacteriaceae bacterium]